MAAFDLKEAAPQRNPAKKNSTVNSKQHAAQLYSPRCWSAVLMRGATTATRVLCGVVVERAVVGSTPLSIHSADPPSQ